MKIFISFITLFILISCSSNEEKLLTIKGDTMGSYYQVKVYSKKDPVKMKADIDKFLELFNNIYSTYIPTSELSKINTSKFDKVKLSDSMVKLLMVAEEVSRNSRGYFDITVGPLVNAWGFGPNGKRKKPTDEEIKEYLAKTGAQHLKLKDHWLSKNKKGMYIDLSAIAKGFGVDELLTYLEFAGHKNMIVEIGGEVRSRGKKADGSAWSVGIEGPSEKFGSKLSTVVFLDNIGMATSGSYRNFVKYGDEIFNHTIDPKTGYPTSHKTISVSVMHEYCADADAWATAFMAMGAKKALKMANENDIMAYIQVLEGKEIKILMTNAYNQYIKKHKSPRS
jgi:thiamine biosynthesis lipoprotein